MPTLELTDEQAIALLQQLPKAQQQRVLKQLAQTPPPPSKPRPQFGSGKKDVLHIANDFYAPLADFEEYR